MVKRLIGLTLFFSVLLVGYHFHSNQLELKSYTRKISSLNSSFSCQQSTFMLFSRELEAHYKGELKKFEDFVTQAFPIAKGQGVWKIRSKKLESIYQKIKKARSSLKVIYSLSHFSHKAANSSNSGLRKIGTSLQKSIVSFSELALSDGIAGRLILSDTGPKGMQEFTEMLIEAIKVHKIEIVSIRNYQLQEGLGYLSEEMLQKLKNAIKSSSRFPYLKHRSLQVLSKKESTLSTGYVSLHFKIRIPQIGLTEIQVRGGTLDKLAEANHLFYDARTGKPLHYRYQDNPKIIYLVEIIKNLNEQQVEQYITYLRQYFRYTRTFETGHSNTPPPQLPKELSSYPELDIGTIWKLIKPYYPIRESDPFNEIFSLKKFLDKLVKTLWV